jgi:hypothetical protein
MNKLFDWADFLQRFATKVLWHFTGYNKSEEDSFGILKSIISERKLRLGKIHSEVILPSGKKRLGYPSICMCDIPFKDLRIHISRYGKYAISFDKTKAIASGQFNPVFYMHKDHFLFKYTEEELLPYIDTLVSSGNEYSEKINNFLLLLGTYVKPSDLTAPISIGNTHLDEMQNNNYYYEREWRSAYEWNFKNEDIEAIMVQKKDIKEINKIIEANGISDVPIITYEMVEKL